MTLSDGSFRALAFSGRTTEIGAQSSRESYDLDGVADAVTRSERDNRDHELCSPLLKCLLSRTSAPLAKVSRKSPDLSVPTLRTAPRCINTLRWKRTNRSPSTFWLLSEDRDKIALRTVCVQNRREFVEAINAFDGGVMIFDGHGHHDQASGAATLRVGREDISIWDMRNEIRVPPIVILSACDTQAADRSHATTANGFLVAGATTVVASLLPLRAPDAAMFIARLVWRLAEFLPAITGPQGRAVLWSEIVSGMFRLQLVYDLIMPLMMAGRLTLPQYSSLNMRAIELTSNQDDAWWNDTIGRLATMLGEKEVAVKARAVRVIATSDAIRYTQIGNPELIVIKKPELLTEVDYDMSGDND